MNIIVICFFDLFFKVHQISPEPTGSTVIDVNNSHMINHMIYLDSSFSPLTILCIFCSSLAVDVGGADDAPLDEFVELLLLADVGEVAAAIGLIKELLVSPELEESKGLLLSYGKAVDKGLAVVTIVVFVEGRA